MGAIESPNAYTSYMAVSTAARGPFAVIGEPIVVVDLINTVAPPGSPAAGDPLPADRAAEAWWRIESARVPGGNLPDIRALHRLRAALREMIEALAGITVGRAGPDRVPIWPTCASLEDRAASGRIRNAAAGHRAARRR